MTFSLKSHLLSTPPSRINVNLLFQSFRIGTVIAGFLFLFGVIRVVFDFRNKILRLRTGWWNYADKKEAFPIYNCILFAGAFISNTVLGRITKGKI
jgi:hypothetical protein